MTARPDSGELLVVFVKLPEPGRVKTRLAATIGAGPAAAVYRELVDLTLKAVSTWLAALPPSDRMAASRQVWIYFDPPDQESAVRSWLSRWFDRWHQHGSSWGRIVPQADGDLGKRLQHVFHQGFEMGFSKIAAIGTDCPALDAALLEAAFESLHRTEMVVGPAADGGYYLIGLTREEPSVFAGIPWSAPDTLAATREAARRGGVRLLELPPLADIDTEADWRRWRATA
jgi:rSAM/selenodomain-associated transferase 1